MGGGGDGRYGERLGDSRPRSRPRSVARCYREQGVVAWSTSSSPHHSLERTPSRAERRIVKVRVLRRWGPVRITSSLHLMPSTVHRVLASYGVARLAHLDRATKQPVCPLGICLLGELGHVDIKKLGNTPDGGSQWVLDRAQGRHNARATTPERGNIGHRSATATYTTRRWTIIPGCLTSKPCPMKRRKRRSRSGSVPHSSLLPTDSPSRGCSPTTGHAPNRGFGEMPSPRPRSPTNAPGPTGRRPTGSGAVQPSPTRRMDLHPPYRSETERREALPPWLHA